MSKGSRKKRNTRPWNNPDALRDIGDLLVPAADGDDLAMEGYVVRSVDAAHAVKPYVCPECGNAIAEGEGHVVVWPEHDADLRRHWHRHCWRIEVGRGGDGG